MMGLMGYPNLSLIAPRPIKFHADPHSKIHINPQIEYPYGELEIQPHGVRLLSLVMNQKSSFMVTPIVNLIIAQNQD